MKLPRIPRVGPSVLARAFIAAALALSAGSAAVAMVSFSDGNVRDGFLLSGVAVFTGWMASAIQQFQQRLHGIDEVVRQGRTRVEQSDALLEEMRRVARRLNAGAEDDKEEDRTIH
ncbi:MAG: hypothetical protein QOD06_1247 [Candidatus Binatota bacterium]|nr:hypothetical protein [Candidatus Binatota bacterium]